MHQDNLAAMEIKEEAQKILMQTFPDDMILEILLRLPAKSLYQFRSVCQSWRSVLGSNFIRSNDKNNNRELLLFFPENYSTLDCYEATSDAADADAGLVQTAEYPFKFKEYLTSLLANKRAWLSLYASCDSWLLVGIPRRRELWLLNPCAREYKKFHCYGDLHVLDSFFGICYDGFENEFEIVSVANQPHRCTKWFFSVFSFKTKSWTEIRELSYDADKMVCCQGRGESIDGAPHWVCCEWNSDHVTYLILSFDVKEEKFVEVPIPHQLKGFGLTAMGGNLFAYRQCNHGLYVWEMKEYGVKESWIQVFHIRGSEVGRPLAITERGEFIMASYRKVFIYNDKNGELKTLKVFEGSLMFEAAPYIDSWQQFAYREKEG